MSKACYPCVHVSGPPYRRGYQHGEQARDRVRRSIAIYQEMFRATAGLDWQSVLERSREFTQAIGAVEPAVLEEMRGIADGARVSLEEVVGVNCRTEILFGQPRTQPGGLVGEECTTIAVAPEASADGHALIGKNWDWQAACRESLIILVVQPDEGPAFVTLVEAGMLARDGVNAAGIAVCGNLLRSTQDRGEPGLPVPIIRRRILTSTRLDDALNAVIRAKRSGSTNYLIGHASGLFINIEATPQEVYFVYPERGLLTHSNHFLSLEARLKGVHIDYSADTLYRHYRARQLLESRLGGITIEDIQAALRDHVGFPRSVCRHPDGREPEQTRTATVASVVVDLTDGVMYVAAGPPCAHHYQAVSVPGGYRPFGVETAVSGTERG
jgi:isopenicillin-N N-acyltransferase-like protein